MNKWDMHKKNDYSLTQAKNDLKEIFQNNHLDDIFEDIDIMFIFINYVYLIEDFCDSR